MRDPNAAPSAAPSTDPSASPAGVVELAASDLLGPGVVPCPNPRMVLWSNHPKVFIDIARSGEGRCPYCGTVYRLKAGEKHASGH